jgi:hypothetical protein
VYVANAVDKLQWFAFRLRGTSFARISILSKNARSGSKKELPPEFQGNAQYPTVHIRGVQRDAAKAII